MTDLTHASFFSGIGGFDVGLERAGFRTVSHSEVKPYSCAVLETRWPDVPNLGDLNALCPDGEGDHDCPIPRATVWSGGFPCSDFSVMGRRKGLLGGNRSSLGLVFLDLVRRHRPPYFVLENVPGLLTSHEGRDLGTLLGLMGDLGYGWSFRLLDARDFGLPQARRRLFIVGAPDARSAGAVLDESTDRGVDDPSLARSLRAAMAGGAGGAARDDRVVLGPTYSAGAKSDAIQRTDAAYPVTPNNFQYVIDDRTVLIRNGFDGYHARRDGAAFTVQPGVGRDDQYVIDDPVVFQLATRRGPALARDDGSSYTLLPTERQHVVVGWNGQQWVVGGDALGGRDGAGLGRRDGDPGAGAGNGSRPAAGADRETEDWLIPVRPRPEDHADGVRETPGLSGRLDDRVGRGDDEVGPKHLDTARWHVLGRSVPVPIIEWIGLGLRAVIEQSEGETR